MSDPHDLLGAYCTDALDPDERAAFEAHLVSCPECRAEAAQFHEILAALADCTPVRPPAGLADRILAQAAAGSAIPDVDEPGDSRPAGTPPRGLAGDPPATRGGLRNRIRPGRWLAAAAAGALLFATGLGVGWSRAGAPPATAGAAEMADIVAVASAGDASVRSVELMGTTSRVVISREMGKSVFLASALPMPAKGMCYQIWRVTDDGQLVSAGAFTPDQDGRIAAVLDGDAAARKFLITLEPPGGSTRPTGPAVGEVAI